MARVRRWLQGVDQEGECTSLCREGGGCVDGGGESVKGGGGCLVWRGGVSWTGETHCFDETVGYVYHRPVTDV